MFWDNFVHLFYPGRTNFQKSGILSDIIFGGLCYITLSGSKCRLFYTCALELITCNDLDALILYCFGIWKLSVSVVA